MLEGAVARILNQLFGKYVVDLDTENLNVGIFSGKVQLTDLKLKSEALFELKLPIQVRAGTIGKIWLQIPWSSLWTQPVIVTIEDIHIIAAPITSRKQTFDADTNKQLLRAFKRKLLNDLECNWNVIGGPQFFSEYLIANILNNLQLNISNVHLRYEDDVNSNHPFVLGLCIGTITAETTNSKWKVSRTIRNAEQTYYLIKLEAFCVYCNPKCTFTEWELPSEYYTWRNAMSASLQNYSLDGNDFQFLIRPMATKLKMTINKNSDGKLIKILNDIIVHDLNVQITNAQYETLTNAYESIGRMLIGWEFLQFRPNSIISKGIKQWWRYAYNATIQQRIKPYTWTKIKNVRENYKLYVQVYKKFLLNPNDMEIKIDLQMYEDRMSLENILIARQQAKLAVNRSNFNEKSFWDVLPSPERAHLCEKINYQLAIDDGIEYIYNFRFGNTSVSLLNDGNEILVITLTQIIGCHQPNHANDSFKTQLKIEGVIIEGASIEEHLIPILSSNHNGHDCPAYFFKLEFEKCPPNHKLNINYRINCVLEYLELAYHQHSFDEIEEFFGAQHFTIAKASNLIEKYPKLLFDRLRKKMLENWDFTLDVKVPYIILPENGSMQTGQSLLIIDFGSYKITTELCQVQQESLENATQIELDEKMYSRFHFDCSGLQILYCENCEVWKDARKERDTDLHIVPKINLNGSYSACIETIRTLPKHKINVLLNTFKLNLSERKLVQLFKFLNSFEHTTKRSVKSESMMKLDTQWNDDLIRFNASTAYLLHIQENVRLIDPFLIGKRSKERLQHQLSLKNKKHEESQIKENMNEVWARCVDLPGLEDNISPNNTISTIIRCVINEFQLVFSKSSDSTDRQYLTLRLGVVGMDMAWMTYGPAYQLTLGSVILTDKLHTTSSGQYLDMIYSPFPSSVDVLTVLYRKVSANCPDFWTHFHGVETSLVADFGTLHMMLHQEAFHTIIKYSKYLETKFRQQISPFIINKLRMIYNCVMRNLLRKQCQDVPVPPGSVKFSHSARLSDLNLRVCDSDFDIINIHLSGFEIDFLFRANERFVFRSFLSKINVEHLSDITLYSKVLYTDEDKVFEVKYIRYASNLNEIGSPNDEINSNGKFKFYLGQLHITFLYKLIVQLHRFIVNLEALAYLEGIYASIKQLVTQAIDTLKTSTKIHLAINLKGPILLIPQKSSLPNVLIIDMGDLSVENFFKEYPNETIENILIKLNDIIVSRGVMTLTEQTLLVQETIMEPLNLHMDVKRFIKSTKTLHWDVDGMIDSIHVTLGQKDLTIILAIYTDNIGEGHKIGDFFNDQNDANAAPDDENVKNLEAFFCEPKQKHLMAKITFENVNLTLFFDSGELLSSPIRDLNHGLCKLNLSDIQTSFVYYTDYSLDGKLAINEVTIEEIGPEANSYQKMILYAPGDDLRNNNCHITVNKPPIIDVTFHQTKMDDKSMDIIIGRLSLCLSVPFIEKLAMFVLECAPKEHFEIGIINHGYIGDQLIDLHHQHHQQQYKKSSLTISLRINRPELIFYIETASKQKRYFLTRMEILLDYSRHLNHENVVLSLSGLHTLFYDDDDDNMRLHEAYTILKQCDVELAKSWTIEKGEKVTLNISSIYLQFCNRVVYSLNDILNDVVEHFKLPETEQQSMRKMSMKKNCELIDLWEAKKLNEFISKTCEKFFNVQRTQHEIFLLPKMDVVVIFELEQIPIILIKSTIEMTIYDWSSLLNSTCELTLQINYFNELVQTWEPIVDPVVLDENVYKPWELFIKVFQDKAQPIFSGDCGKSGKMGDARVKKSNHFDEAAGGGGGDDGDEESGDDMIYLEPINGYHTRQNRRVKTSLSTFLDDSDSENEDGCVEKLAAAISDLFTGDWNESDGSDCEQSSDGDDDDEDDSDDNNIKSQEFSLSESINYKKATYILIDAKDVFNLTITPTFMKTFNDLYTMYANKTLSIANNERFINIINDIGPQSKIELYENRGNEENALLILTKTYEKEDSCPSSPAKSVYCSGDFLDDTIDDKESMNEEQNKFDDELGYDFDTINSLEFPQSSTTQMYNKINKHYVKIQVPGFQTQQTSCPRRSGQKLIKLQALNNNQIYYLNIKCTINKTGRTIIISSPLQIRNETCFALSILYQPSVLQQLNLEPVGDVTNPFETTMRIAVLEPHEHYNVPLYIAYHCKLFIQPAYAEGHYASNKGIWWKDLVTEIDTAHNFHCDPKSKSNLEVFSLRVILRKNYEAMKQSHIYSIPNYIIHLLPPLIFHNFLPYTILVENLELKLEIKVEPGEKSSIYSLNLSKDQKLSLKMTYCNTSWMGTLNLTPHLDEKVVILSASDGKVDGGLNKHLAINIKAEREESCNVYFYTPYWIINRTNLPLNFKASSTNLTYSSNNEEIILFTYKRHGKQTLQLKVYESDWSNEFGLDCAYTNGLIVCKDIERRKRYSFLLSIQLTEMCPKLTKIVTLLPCFLIINNTNKMLRFMEHNEKTDLWIDLNAGQSIAFWPETNSMQMYVKFRDSKVTSQPFCYATQSQTVLRMDKGSALTVNITGGKSKSFQVKFNDYKEGDAPIYMKNLCVDTFLKVQQQGQTPVTVLSPYNGLMYTWDDPTKPRQLFWNVYNNKGNGGFYLNIHKDGYGEEKINLHSTSNATGASSSDDSDSCDNSAKTHLKMIIYWIVYRDGLQRTLIFTDDQSISNNLIQCIFMETSDIECLLSLAGIGVSLFTSSNPKKEHLYLSMSDRPATWEVNVGHKWKTLTLELASWIEDKYRLHYKKCQLKDYVHIDFEKMFMLKPFFAELRRSYNPAIYCQVRKSKNYQCIDIKLHSMHIDNKQVNSNDSVILCPLPVHQSLKSLKSATPFIEFQCIRNVFNDCRIYKNLYVNIKDFYLNIQSDLLIKIVQEFMQTWKTQIDTPMLYRNDMSRIHLPLSSSTDRMHFNAIIIEHLYLSPTLIQLNILNKSHSNHVNLPVTHITSIFFPYNISPYMPIEGVRHKINGFQVSHINSTLMNSCKIIWNHYTTQFLQQYYAQVLGLQVLVNPYATQQISNAEKSQSDVEKMSSTILYGCRCLLGHVNMSSVALEQCIIETFVNQSMENIQRIRRYGPYHKTSDVPKSVLASSRNFNPGVILALDQIIAKSHIAGIQSDGEVFFRGTGKALISLVTRHPDERTNCVNVAIEALKRAAILGEPIKIHQRLTRYCNQYLGLKPFSIYESMGCNLLETIANGRFIKDNYWTHATLDKSGKSILIVSLEHIVRMNKCRLWGPWELEWCLDLDDIISVPKVTSSQLIFNVRQGDNYALNQEGQLIVEGDKEILGWLQERVEQAIVVSMEDKSWMLLTQSN